MKHAQIIAAAIDHLAANADAPPDLESLAKRAGYEPTHFQKLFKDYVGISPKRMCQYMAMRRAREFLNDGSPTLDAAYGAGLSGNGRLHDLFISCEGVTPGEVKTRGAGLSIIYGFYPTPIGEVMIGKTGRGICWLGFLVDESRDEPTRRMKRYWPMAKFFRDDAAVEGEGAKITALWRGQGPLPLSLSLKGEGRRAAPGRGFSKLKLDIYGTNFQIQVWQALLRIPFGATKTYQDIGAEVGKPKASRAVGNAVGANPVSLLIPCHRVIRATGIVDNYGWGSARKKMILGVEGVKSS